MRRERFCICTTKNVIDIRLQLKETRELVVPRLKFYDLICDSMAKNFGRVSLAEGHAQIYIIFTWTQGVYLGSLILGVYGQLPVTFFQIDGDIPRYT